MTNNQKEIKAILLNGRHVKFPIDYNIEEGWVEFEVLKPTKTDSLIEAGKSVDIEKINVNSQEPTWQLKKEFGEVELIYC